MSVVFALLTFGDFSWARGRLGWSPRLEREALLHALAALRPIEGVLFVFLTWLTLPLRAWSWGLVLRPSGDARTRYHATAVGFFAVNVLPARLGEVARGLLLASRVQGLPRAQAVGSVLFARLLDLWALWLLTLPMPLLLNFAPARRLLLSTLLAGISALVAATMFLVWVARRAGRRDQGHPPLGSRAFARFLAGIGPALSWSRLGRAFGATVLIQLVSAAAYVPVLLRLCPEVPPFSSAVVALAGLSLGLALPSTPSGVGVYHYAMSFALESIGATPAHAAAAALVTHLGSLVAFVGAGLASLGLAGMGFGALLGRADRTPAAEKDASTAGSGRGSQALSGSGPSPRCAARRWTL